MMNATPALTSQSAAPAVASSAALKISPIRTLLPLIFFQVSAGVDEDQALRLIESRHLWPVFDIARPSKGRREVRVLRDSLLSFSPDQRRAKVSAPDTVGKTILAAMPARFAQPKATIRGTELKYRLSCSPSHIKHLIDEGELRQTGKEGAGRNASPVICFASLISFLNRRLMF